MEQIHLEAISRHKKKKVAEKSQHRFTKDKSCPINLTAFCDEMTQFVKDRRIMDMISLTLARLLTLIPTVSLYLS